MASDSMVLEKTEDYSHQESQSVKNRKEFVARILSSFVFIPVIVLVFFVSCNFFKLMCLVAYVIIVCEIFSPKIEGEMIVRVIAALFCLIGIVSFIYCRHRFGAIGCCFLICITSFTDIGAYLFGKILKGPKLCPEISPNKTWAGVFGGIVLANTAFYFFYKFFFGVTITRFDLLGENIGVLLFIQYIVLASLLGDLLESMFKRKIGVKDMGNLFPGHGGVLDRLDSLLLSSIAMALVGIFFRW